MKNSIFKLILACLVVGVTQGQQENNTEFKTQTLQVYQNLNKNNVPHGILLDFGMEFTNLKAYNGILTDSTYTTSQTLSDIYKTLLMCRVRAVNTGFITPEEYTTRWYTQREEDVITLSGQYFKYSRFSDNAYPSKINYSNNQFSDKYVSGVWQNPYEEKQLFAMAPSTAKYKGFNLNVKLPENLFFSNYPTTVQSIQIDFGDGLGYRTATYGQLLNVSYTQANIYTWIYKINLTNGQSLLSHSKVQIEEGLNAIDLNNPKAKSADTKSANNLDDYYKTTITATEPYLNHYGSATVYIRYANGGSSITKPLIVAEGFDTGIVLNPEQEAGDNNIEDFISDINNSTSVLLDNEVDTYDIIYLDWNNGVDFLQRNAYVLEEVIKWVNNTKTTSVPNVVLGQSMGGLIARYALRDIEVNRSFNHDTRLYVSHDAPHLGANTPLSVQLSARHLRNQYINTPIALLGGEVLLPLAYDFAQGFSSIINLFGADTSSPPTITPLRAFSLADVAAARQMQYTWVSTNYQMDNTIHNVWQSEYLQMGYPQGYTGQSIRNIAIANGSECGITQIDNSNILSYIKDAGRDTVLSNYIGILDAVFGAVLLRPDIAFVALFPGSSYWEIDFQSKYMTLLNENKNIYHGSIKYKKKVLWFIPVSITLFNKNVNQPSGVFPYDIYGGGWQQAPTNNIPLSGIVSNAFGFVPSASALDVGSGSTALNDLDYRKPYVGALPPVAPKNTLFQNFVTHFDPFNPNNNNSPHISFNRRNGDWLRSEMNEGITPEMTNCSFICSSSSNIINGYVTLCTSGVYSVNTTGDAVVNWSLNNPSAATLSSSTGSSVTVTAVNGYRADITLTANISSSNCGGSAILTKNIRVGKPDTPASLTGPSTVNTGALVSYQAGVSNGATSYSWYLPYPYTTVSSFDYFGQDWQLLAPGNSTIAQTFTGYAQNAGYVQVMGTNNCGNGGAKLLYVQHGSGGGGGIARIDPTDNVIEVSLYPNPAKNKVTVSLTHLTEYDGEPPTVIYGIKIMDLNLVERQFYQFKEYKNQEEINVAFLTTGLYTLIVYTDTATFTKKLLID